MIVLPADPIAVVIRAIHELYPSLEAEIYWADDIDSAAQADLDSKLILLNVNSPLGAIPELIAHEAAHLIVGQEGETFDANEHGPKWAEANMAIHSRYVELMLDLSRRQEEDSGRNNGDR